MITNADEYKPHEVICIYCINRWISVHEQGEWLAKCGMVGGIIYRTTIIIFLLCQKYCQHCLCMLFYIHRKEVYYNEKYNLL